MYFFKLKFSIIKNILLQGNAIKINKFVVLLNQNISVFNRQKYIR